MSENQQLRLQYVEDVSLFYEQAGMPRMAGRIIGWLLIADPPHQTMNDLTEALGASKSSISSMTRYLMERDLIDRISLPGHRRDFYLLKPLLWEDLIQRRHAELTTLRMLAERGLDLMAEDSADNQQRVKGMVDFARFFEAELPGLLDKWRGLRTQATGE